MSEGKKISIYFFFFPLFRFFLSRSSLVWGLWGNIYSLGGRDGSISGGTNTLKVEEGGERRWDELTKRDGDLQAFVNTPFLFFSTLIQTFIIPFFSPSSERFLVSFCLLLEAFFENSSVSVPTYYPSTTYLTYYRTWRFTVLLGISVDLPPTLAFVMS